MQYEYRLKYFEPYEHVSLNMFCSVMLRDKEHVFLEERDEVAQERVEAFLKEKVKVLDEMHPLHPKEFVKILQKW